MRACVKVRPCLYWLYTIGEHAGWQAGRQAGEAASGREGRGGREESVMHVRRVQQKPPSYTEPVYTSSVWVK